MKRLKNKFISATDFSRGKAIVKSFGCDENFCINKNGEILFKTQFHTFGHFNEFDQIIIYNNESLCGVMDNRGKIVIPCKYDDIYQRPYGYTLEKDNVCTIVKTNFPTASFVQRNITSVPDCIPDRKNGKEGIIQVPSKEIIIPFEYDFCGWFLEYELAEVRKNGKSGFVNPQNEIIIPLEYDRVGLFGFKYGICLVEKDGKCGFIDKNNNLEQQIFTIFDNIFPNVRDGENTISNYFSPKRGKNLLSKNAILGDVPVIAGGLNPATYHNVANTNAPVITISASGANAGFVNLWHIPVWSSDSSYIDNTITSNIYFWYVMLKKRQQEIFDSQTGSAQPHIYPQHIEGMTVSDIDMNLVNDFNDNVTPLFINMGENIKENQKLIQLRDTLLPKLMSGEIDVSKVDISADKLLFSILVFEHFYIKIVILIGVTINEKIIITISIIVFIDRLLFCGYNKFLR